MPQSEMGANSELSGSKSMQHEITYIIPVFNGASLIERAIRSVLAQPGPQCKIVVVDDGSTDGTADIVRQHFPSAILIEQKNAGPSAARNTGLRIVDTDIVCFMDADDYIIGEHAKSTRKLWNKTCDVVVGLSAEGSDEVVNLRVKNKYDHTFGAHELMREFLRGNYVQTATFSWSTRFARSIGGWNEAIFGPDDIEFALRAFTQNPSVVISNLPGWVVWYQHSQPGRITGSLNARVARGVLDTHKSIAGLLRLADQSLESKADFGSRCLQEGRLLYLNGFVLEANELFSLAREFNPDARVSSNGEALAAKVFGLLPVLGARAFMGRMKRALLCRVLPSSSPTAP